ncbi:MULTISPECIES: ATP-binding cassette domain-containing protein [unclassified Pseudomonas]|uniref:ATP-binding cassette domain-containing protein n=1 Tax=unclassified Pseudomonas TaxID=196821 RepID=UPI002D7F8C25|nr:MULTISPECIES: ATP-binding cassette domain-containing protein [unclassified Pseudomonas]
MSLQLITRSFAGRAALVDISLTIPTGQTCAIVGLSGAGKSTLLDRPCQGRLLLGGHVEHVDWQAQQPQAEGAWFELRIALDEQPDPLALGVRLGMSAQVQVRLHSTAQAVVLPLEAVQGDAAEGHWVVFRRDGESVAQQVPVRVDAAQVAGVQVQGLEAGWVWVAERSGP